MVDEGQFLFTAAFKQIDGGVAELKYQHFVAPNESRNLNDDHQ